jgi:APA family basic amino acid/polyamine antiporter
VIGPGSWAIGTAAAGQYDAAGHGPRAAGPALVLSFVLLASPAPTRRAVHAELAAMIPQAGSAYACYATLGELVAWIIGWI